MTEDPARPEPAAEGGGRAERGRRRHRERGPVAPAQPPWRRLHRRMEPVRAVSEDQLESIHVASLRVLSETGIDFLHPTARQLWAERGRRRRRGTGCGSTPSWYSTLTGHRSPDFTPARAQPRP